MLTGSGSGSASGSSSRHAPKRARAAPTVPAASFRAFRRPVARPPAPVGGGALAGRLGLALRALGATPGANRPRGTEERARDRTGDHERSGATTAALRP